MRTEEQIFELIISFARNDHRIRAVILQGSRANPNAKKDIYQDFDIVYIVTDVQAFKNDSRIVEYFGEIMIMQKPEDMISPQPENKGSYIYLMQFMDRNRIDLRFCPIKQCSLVLQDSLSIVLMDKDELCVNIQPPSELSYLPKSPSAKEFADCCNEFLWLTPTVAKALCRRELIYAKQILDVKMRKQLMKVLEWYFGIITDFQVSPGKGLKNLKHQLDRDLWQQIKATYSNFDLHHIWDSLSTMGTVFKTIAVQIAQQFNYSYPFKEDKEVTRYIRTIEKF